MENISFKDGLFVRKWGGGGRELNILTYLFIFEISKFYVYMWKIYNYWSINL